LNAYLTSIIALNYVPAGHLLFGHRCPYTLRNGRCLEETMDYAIGDFLVGDLVVGERQLTRCAIGLPSPAAQSYGRRPMFPVRCRKWESIFYLIHRFALPPDDWMIGHGRNFPIHRIRQRRRPVAERRKGNLI
jgi:hypothetical protein